MVIQWSMDAARRRGYFAALYKRITVAVRQAIAEGAFEDGPRMELFDVAFAARYLDALNGHFHPGDHPRPTRCWQVTFDAAHRAEPILLQHMLAGVNAHIDFDLGIAATQIACRTGLSELHEDFGRINAVLASQVNGVLTDIGDLSPALADVSAVLMGHEIFAVNEAVRVLRDSAWRFAVRLCAAPAAARPLMIWARDRKVAGQGRVIYDPPSLTGVLASAVRAVAAQESRDVVHNIEVLDEIASAPALIRTTL